MTTKPSKPAKPTTAKQKPTAIELALPGIAAVSLIPATVRADADNDVVQADAIVVIESVEALTTADTLASRMSARKKEIEETIKSILGPFEAALKAAKAGASSIVDALDTARGKLAERVVAAKVKLGVAGSEGWACYASEIDDLQIKEFKKIPHSVEFVNRETGKLETVELLKVDTAAVKRALKLGVAVPGVYLATKQSFGVRSK